MLEVQRVKQGHAVEYGGIWYAQGQEFVTPTGAKFETTIPDLDKDGNQSGTIQVSQVEKVREIPEAADKEAATAKKADVSKPKKDAEG